MATELVDTFPFLEEQHNNQPPNNSWLLDDVYTPGFPQDLQAIEDHLFNFETDPLLSLPKPDSSFSSFFMDFSDDFNPIQESRPEPMITEQCIEPDVCDTFLNDYEFSPGPISPIDNPKCIDDFYNCTASTTVTNPNDLDPLRPMITGSKNTADVTTPMNKDDNNDDEEEEEEEEEETYNEPKRGTLNCKNLVSERNRRKRLSQQLLALRALVPNITKMDKRSVLVDALSYLRNIHEETARLQKELKQQHQHPKISDLKESNQDNPAGTLRVPRSLASAPISKPKAQITEIDTEKIEDKRFVVKITCKGVGSIGGDVLRVFESLDFEITYTSLQQLKPQEVLVTIFIRVRKQGKMTEEKLKDCITSMALRSGLTFQNP